ncbi:MAG: sensor histidine kinase, partial [Sphingomonas sp.]
VEPVSAFRWETGAEGVIRWVDDAPRGPLIGLSVAGREGLDEAGAAAFEKRAPFRDARMRIAGDGAAAGDWRISGVPYFDPARGAFLGYRGSARRPRASEAASGMTTPFGPDLPPDSLRQLVHELRTPLNAIMGFAELIEGEFMGPAATQYRDRATEIMSQARGLLTTVDDLDTAARIETRRLDVGSGRTDLDQVLERLAPSYEATARNRGALLRIETRPGLPSAAVTPENAERLMARLLAATIGLAQEGEAITARLDLGRRDGREMLRFAIDRPRIVAGLDEMALLDPVNGPAGDWPGAPGLGLGFALSLVRKLSQANGGDLAIGADSVQLFVPKAGEDAR